MSTVAHLVFLSGMIPILIGIIRYRHLSPTFRLFFGLRIFLTAITCYALILGNQGINNLHATHIYLPVDFAILLHIYRKAGVWQISSKGELALSVVFTSILLLCLWQVHGWDKAPTIPILLEALFFFFLAGAYLVKKFTQLTPSWKVDPLIWVSIGLLIYFSFSFFTHLVYNQWMVGKSRPFFIQIYRIHQYSIILVNLIYGYAFWLFKPSHQKATITPPF